MTAQPDSNQTQLHRLAVAVEFSKKPVRFEQRDFEALIDQAVKVVLGQAGLARPYTVSGEFDENKCSGSVLVPREHLHILWSALSIYGCHFGTPIAIHCQKHFLLPPRTKIDLHGKHALVTGGSKGIGKALAIELVRQGASVTIVARDEATLVDTCNELQKLCDLNGKGQQAAWYSLDVTKSPETTQAVINRAEEKLGEIDILVNNAGNSVQDAFEKLPVESFERQMKLNYLSAVYATRAVVNTMKRRRSGRIAFVSSAAGQLGIYGYSAYAPAKFALRGFAEAIQMELEPYNIAITVVYPPNTDTEGFQEELRTMPKEVRLISETAGLFSPKDVAKLAVHDIVHGKFATNIGTDGWMLGTLTAGGAPETSVFGAAQQILFGGLFRGILLAYHSHFRRLVQRCAEEREQEKRH
uniref:3-dehydrosphinganine reductase n=1 Tax=Plectus sambesii TaxID=2011161 RepID=A0A914WAM7_9BILA